MEGLLITLSLGDLMLEEEKVMSITKHKSVKQMRKDYGPVRLFKAVYVIKPPQFEHFTLVIN